MSSARVLNVRNPRSGEDDATIRCWSVDDLTAEAGTLRSAQQAWAVRSYKERVDILQRWAASLQGEAGEAVLAALSIDTGRRMLAAGELRSIPFVVAQAARFAEEVFAEPDAQPLAADSEVTFSGMLQAYPLVGVISPWNFPLLLSLLDSIAALVAGSAVIVKPSEITPRFIEPLQESIDAIDELRGVFRLVSGDGETGAALIDTVDAICFTGSVATGKKVAAAAAANMIPAFLELGGKDPAIVLGSADPELAASTVLRASVQATGQACQSIERVYVVDTVYDAFVASLVEQAQQVELNYPDINNGHIGPLIMEGQAAVISAQLQDAVKHGATIHCGGEVEQHGGGLWIRPTVLTGVTHEMQVMLEETFGPVIPVMRVADAAAAVAMANDSHYGLSAAVIGDKQEARLVAESINAGAISINDGGLTTIAFEAEKDSYGLSGLGASRMGRSGLQRFLRKKALLTRHGAAPDISSMSEEG